VPYRVVPPPSRLHIGCADREELDEAIDDDESTDEPTVTAEGGRRYEMMRVDMSEMT
jgi:hypothetical protein